MKIQLISKNNEYGFNVVSDSGHRLFCSPKHYFLSANVSSSYKYAWEAYRDARKLIYKTPYHLATEVTLEDSSTTENSMTTTQLLDVSAEQMITDHYMNILDGLKEKVRGTKGNKVDKNKVYQEVKLVTKELKIIQEKLTDNEDKLKIRGILKHYIRLMRKYFPDQMKKDEEEEQQKQATPPTQPEPLPQSPMPSMPPALAKSNSILRQASLIDPESDSSPDFKKELMEEYANKICEAIQYRHKEAYCHFNPDGDELVVKEKEQPILKVRINKHYLIDNIVPVGKLQNICPIHSSTFYQSYWKPIVENLKHFCISNPTILIPVERNILPDMNEKQTVKGWNVSAQRYEDIDIDFKNETWIMETSKTSKIASVQMQDASKYTEQDYIDAVVKCIDSDLKSIFGRTGVVIQIIPSTDYIEVDVDFGRGLGIVRLTEKQIEIMPI